LLVYSRHQKRKLAAKRGKSPNGASKDDWIKERAMN